MEPNKGACQHSQLKRRKVLNSYICKKCAISFTATIDVPPPTVRAPDSQQCGEYNEKKKITIAELEAILNADEDVEIEILPNGEIRTSGVSSGKPRKPLTMRENLGGEYSTNPQ